MGVNWYFWGGNLAIWINTLKIFIHSDHIFQCSEIDSKYWGITDRCCIEDFCHNVIQKGEENM